MKTKKITVTALLWIVASLATAQSVPEYDRVRGELSPGTQAPTRAAMLDAIQHASPSAIFSILEYGERVECFECMPALHDKLINSGDSRVREIAAWWLRRRPFGFGAAMRSMRQTLSTDSDPVHRARAAEAMGEFMDSHGADPLKAAAQNDADSGVRAAAVRALGRLNVRAGHETIVAGLADRAVEVRVAALSVLSRVSGFSGHAAIVPLLSDAEVTVRRKAALALGDPRTSDSVRASAVAALTQLIQTDADLNVRQAAAWTLGRIGTTEARQALTRASSSESEPLVQNAITIALQM